MPSLTIPTISIPAVRDLHLDRDPPPTRAGALVAMLNPLLTFSLLYQYPRHIIVPQFPSLSTATPFVASLSFVRMDIVSGIFHCHFLHWTSGWCNNAARLCPLLELGRAD